jgi:GntR family transcriptional regulator/MocR family aminotransferase
MPVVLALNPDDKRTLQTQVFQELRAMILEGRLRSGDAVPGTRVLSEQLGVSRNTVVLAYERLYAEGYIETQANVGTFVSSILPEAAMSSQRGNTVGGERVLASENDDETSPIDRLLVHKHERADGRRLKADFWIGRTESKLFPKSEWRKIVETKLRHQTDSMSVYGGPEGLETLRSAVSDHVGPSRGISTNFDNVLITSGTQDGLTLLAMAFKDKGYGFLHEDPCYLGALALFTAMGYASKGVQVDNQGIKIDELPKTGKWIVYVTPSHQYPIGSTLSLERRFLLLEWARKTGSYIVEDDYDGEFRYDGAPLTSLRGLDQTGRVIYLGTFSKSFGPALRLGYLIANPKIMHPLRDWKQLISNGTGWMKQAAMAEFIHSGGYRRHLRRIRTAYMKRRDCLVSGLHNLFGDCQIVGETAGIHISWSLPAKYGSPSLLEKSALLNGIGIYRPETGGAWISKQNKSFSQTVVMGYAAISEAKIESSISGIDDCLRGLEK